VTRRKPEDLKYFYWTCVCGHENKQQRDLRLIPRCESCGRYRGDK